MKTTIFQKQKIDTSKYVNIDTGETLASEQPDLTSINKATDLVIISSTEYVIIDSKAREYIQANFNQAEVGRIIQMADMVKGCYNLLFNKKTALPHTKDTLAEELEYSRNIFADFMKKLYKKSVIYYISGVKNNRECVWIMLNPTFARKSKSFKKACVNVFEDLSKK